MKNVNLKLSDELHSMLKRLSRIYKKTMSDVLKGAICLENRIQDEVEKGGRVFVENKDGEKVELFLR